MRSEEGVIFGTDYATPGSYQVLVASGHIEVRAYITPLNIIPSDGRQKKYYNTLCDSILQFSIPMIMTHKCQ